MKVLVQIDHGSGEVGTVFGVKVEGKVGGVSEGEVLGHAPFQVVAIPQAIRIIL